MQPNIFGALADAGFWNDVGINARKPFDSLYKFGEIPTQADTIAQQTFANSDRDGSTQNAFRHALGTGMTAQALGGGPLAAAAAKGLGYVWEGMDIKRLASSPQHRQDTLHDLNANAIGAQVAQKTNGTDDLVSALKRMALQSVPVNAPAVFQSSPGYLTRSGR